MKSHKKEKSSVAVSAWSSRNVLSAHKQTDLHILESSARVRVEAGLVRDGVKLK